MENAVRSTGSAGNALADIAKERGQNIGDILHAASSPETSDAIRNKPTIPEVALQTAGQYAGGVGDVIGKAGMEVLHGIRNLAPEHIDELKNTISKGFKYIANTDVGKLGIDAVKKGGAMWSNFQQNYPNEAKDIESMFNIGLLMAPVKGRENPPIFPPEKIAMKLEASASKQLAARRNKFIDELVRPEQTKKVRIEQTARTSEEGLLHTKVVQPSATEQEIASEVRKIPGVNHSRDFQYNLNVISDANKNIANDLRTAVEKRTLPIPRRQVMSDIRKSINDMIKKNPTISSDNNLLTMANHVADNAARIINSYPATPGGLLSARQAFDSWAKKIQKKVFDGGDKISTFKESVDSVRSSMNDSLAKAVPSAEVKGMLKRQHLLFKAMDNIAPKAGAQSINAVIRLMDKVRPLGALRTTIVQNLGTISGMGIIGASAFFSPVIAKTLATAGIGYVGGRMILSPTAKRGLAALLRATNETLTTTKSPSLIRQLRADREVLATAIKNSEIMNENKGQ